MSARSSSTEPRLRAYTEGDRAAIEGVLRACFPDDPDVADLWHWKHLMLPGGRPDEIIVAELDDKVVGCFHTTVLPLQIGDGSQILASFDADFGVVPEGRGLGLTARAYALTDRLHFERGVPIRGGFAGIVLNARVHGNVGVPSSARTFRKVVGVAALRNRAEAIGKRALSRPWVRRALEARENVIDVQVEGLPDFHLRLTGSGFFLDAGLAGSQMGVKAPYSLLLALNGGSLALLGALTRGLATGRIRISGVGRWMFFVLRLLTGILRRPPIRR